MSSWKTTHFKSHVIFENEQISKQEWIPSGRCLPGERKHLTLMITLLKTWMKGYLSRGVLICVFLHESAHPQLACLDKHILPVNRMTQVPKHYIAPNFVFQAEKFYFFLWLNSSFESFMQKNSRQLLIKLVMGGHVSFSLIIHSLAPSVWNELLFWGGQRVFISHKKIVTVSGVLIN